MATQGQKKKSTQINPLMNRIMGYFEFKLNLELNYHNTYKQDKKVRRLYKQYLNEKKIQGKI
nr:hypothetical protein [uncultured Mediterranean phage uvMED]